MFNIFTFLYRIFLGLAIIVCIFLILPLLPISGNFKILTVLSGSMEPAIRMGSAVVMAPAKDYKVGDVITFGAISKTDIPVTHRIIEAKLVDGKPVYVTKGDANNAADSKETPLSEVDGKVLFSIPYFGFVLNFLKKPLGFAAVIIIPAILIIWEEAMKIYREVNKNKKKPNIPEVKEEETKNV